MSSTSSKTGSVRLSFPDRMTPAHQHNSQVAFVLTSSPDASGTRFLTLALGMHHSSFCTMAHPLTPSCRKAQDIVDGRKSFPSGHSATAWSGMFYASLFIAGQTAAWCFYHHRSPSILGSRILRLILTMMPLAWALHVALSRMEDYVGCFHRCPI